MTCRVMAHNNNNNNNNNNNTNNNKGSIRLLGR